VMGALVKQGVAQDKIDPSRFSGITQRWWSEA
jgi:hypothetical protein